jgi:adenine-specific DNA-methyltransferase
MRYIGSKASSLIALEKAIAEHGSARMNTICDPFSGICTVSRYFKKQGYRILTGDVLYQSYLFQLATVQANHRPRFRALCKHLQIAPDRHPSAETVLDYLNALPGKTGFVTRNYSPFGTAKRKFFRRPNAIRIDAIRQRIALWKRKALITRIEEAYLLTSLLHAVDAVANTAGTYYAFLKRFYRKAKKPLLLRNLDVHNNAKRNGAHHVDANALVTQLTTDILYLDPPYNERDYAHYYHLTESIACWDQPTVQGVAGLPKRRIARSKFCSPTAAQPALADLIKNADAKLILLHYSVSGLVPHSNIMELLTSRGPTTFRTWYVRRYGTVRNKLSSCKHRLYVCKPRH